MQNATFDRSIETSTAKSRATLLWSAALTFCVLLTALVSSVALLVFAIRSIDGAQAANEAALAQRNVQQNLKRVASDLVSATTWDEAYVRSRTGAVDMPWVESEWGVYFHDHFGHDLTVAVDGNGRPFYAALNGRTAPVGDFASFVRAARPLTLEVERAERARRFGPDGRRAVGMQATASVTGIVRWKGALYLTAASNVTPETTRVAQSAGPDALVISARVMGPAFLQSMQDILALEDLQLGPVGAAPKDHIQAVVLRDAGGRAIGQLAWTPSEAGHGVLVKFSLLIAAGLVVLGAASAALMMRVKSMVSRLLAKDEALRGAMDELTKARDDAQAANSAKSAFVANISHEIRTPLNGLIGMAQVMTAYPLDPGQQIRLKVVHESAHTLLALLNDVLDMAKIEAGRLEIALTPTDLRDLTASVCQPFAEMAAAKGLDFDLSIEPQVEALRLCDGLRVRQILANLASNAVKFTDAGGVKIMVRATLDGVRFHCVDTGIGMAADDLPDLFSKFSQLDGSDTRRAAGAGLGLALSRELAQMMGGRLSVQSAVGKGSIFTFDLPAGLARPKSHVEVAAVVEAVAGGAGRPLRVLAAEDNLVNRMVLQALLAPRGVELTLAEDGFEAVELYIAGDFDLVLMDIQMPVMSGIDATKAIRAYEAGRGKPPVPILAVTANVLSHQRQAYVAAGMDDCIAKPIEAARLHQAIDDALGGESIPAETIAAAWVAQTAALEPKFRKAG